MFDYFSKTKNLHNLLWVYSPDHGAKVASYYPGDRYVDVVGLDAYTDLSIPSTFAVMRNWPRCPSPSGSRNSDLMARPILPATTTTAASCRAFKLTSPKHPSSLAGTRSGRSPNHHAKELLDDPAVINREDVPKNLAAPSAPLDIELLKPRDRFPNEPRIEPEQGRSIRVKL